MGAEDEVASITVWIGDLKEGGDTAAQKLWEHYCERLAWKARRYLQGKLPAGGISDEDDVANIVYQTFCRRLRLGQFSRIDNRDDLWRLLVVITKRKASHVVRYETQQVRDVRRVVRDGDMKIADGEAGGLDQVAGGRLPRGGVWVEQEPSAEEAAEVAEQCCRRLELLGDKVLQEVALARLDGYTDAEIATRFNRTRRWVQRRLEVIRGIWSDGSD
jgi:DNA-directed RNA polymerase specialized sigma24 family protein